MSFGEPIALRGQAELEEVVSAAPGVARESPDASFIERLQAGEAAAFNLLVAERTGDIYALLYRLTEDHEEARDLTQETFLRAFQKIDRFRGDSDLKTWIYRIAINQARNRWRWWKRRRRDSTVSLDDPNGNQPDQFSRLYDIKSENPEQMALVREREKALRVALRKIARPYREAVILRDIEGLTYEEIASALEITIGTVKSRISRGRIELRRKLEGSL